MTPEQLDAIRARNETRRDACPDGVVRDDDRFIDAHSECEDDIDALLAEVERLSAEQGYIAWRVRADRRQQERDAAWKEIARLKAENANLRSGIEGLLRFGTGSDEAIDANSWFAWLRSNLMTLIEQKPAAGGKVEENA